MIRGITPPPGQRQRVQFRNWLSSRDLLTWTWRSPRRCLSPKHQFGFRATTQLDPLDTILYTALIYEIGAELEDTRVSWNENVVHSYRFSPQPNGQMFSPDYGFDSFRKRSIELAGPANVAVVVVADIADFYPRIYSHPLENALSEATTKKEHVRVLKHMLAQLNHTVSYGIPVGPAASRLLAEVAISDIDAALMSDGWVHTRFVDDFRIFCDSERSAYSALAFLANTLFEHHGLTLQQHKTYIQSREDFLERNGENETDIERRSLSERFEAILQSVGINNPYSAIDYDDLDEGVQEQIDALNLGEILHEQISSTEPLDILITRFALRRLAQLGDQEATANVLANIQRLYPVFKDSLAYLTAIRSALPVEKHATGRRILNLINHDIVGHLEFHRAWILSTFTQNGDWNNAEHFIPIFNRYDDPLTRREAILALGRAGKSEWFKGRKRRYEDFDPLQRRAFLAAASCLPGDEAEHWYRAVAPRLDELEKAVVDWALLTPFA
jgi:hypothetical protein